MSWGVFRRPWQRFYQPDVQSGLGTLTSAGAVTVAVTGLEATASVGTAVATGAALTALSGVEASGGVGQPNLPVNGFTLTTELGTVTVTASDGAVSYFDVTTQISLTVSTVNRGTELTFKQNANRGVTDYDHSVDVSYGA